MCEDNGMEILVAQVDKDEFSVKPDEKINIVTAEEVVPKIVADAEKSYTKRPSCNGALKIKA